MDFKTEGFAKHKDPFWYKDALVYELHVRSFFDSNADGIGDFPGLTQKLDYVADLGVTALWLLPFYPSPLKDGGYDIADYETIDSSYGTMKDWRNFLRKAHELGMRVITELVLNHTSDQHAWFQRARRAPKDHPFRDFYVWTNDPQKYKDARVIFKDFELSNWTWDPVANSYYWHRFYSHQPDLNFDSPDVHKAIFRVIDFWLDQGVDGFRLDAIPYLYERENTSCEGLPETHQFLKDLRRHVDGKYRDRMLLAEANQWPEEAVTYFGEGQGDECHMAFHFPLMPRLFMGVRMEDRLPIVDILEQTPLLPPTSQWALFLRNHDELTLEMVTDEERDYMYRVYAQDIKARVNLGIRRRLAPLLGNDRRKIELLNLLLLSMPGTPVIYYGDEIGMGDNIYLGDRFGVRTPMQWSSDKNAGFSRASPQALPLPIIVDPEFHYEAVNVEAQQRNPNSLLWWTKRLISLRKTSRAFGRGTIEFVPTANRKVLAFVRSYESENILVVANLARTPQPVELDLSAFKGLRPVECFGHTEFPVISSAPYFLTLAPHSALWFFVRPAKDVLAVAGSALPKLYVEEDWREVLAPGARLRASLFKNFFERQPWYLGKGRTISDIQVLEQIGLESVDESACLTLLQVDYVQGDPETYLVPLAFASGEGSRELRENFPELIVCHVSGRTQFLEGVLYDAVAEPALAGTLLAVMSRRRALKGRNGECRSWHMERIPGPEAGESVKQVLVIRSNSSLVIQDRWFLKLFRRIEPGMNPEIELSRRLAKKKFANMPPLFGGLEYRNHQEPESINLGILSGIVPDAKTAWLATAEILGRYFDRIQTVPAETVGGMHSRASIATLATQEVPVAVSHALGSYIDFALLLGKRTCEMHQALADSEERDFVPEPFTPFYLRSLYQSIRNRFRDANDLVRISLPSLNPDVQAQASQLMDSRPEVLKRLQKLFQSELQGVRIRVHCNYGLHDVLFSGKDFFIVDFEGDPARPLSERRLKRPFVYDLAWMILSFHHAAHAAVERQRTSRALNQEKVSMLAEYADVWSLWAGACFVKGYLEAGTRTDLISRSIKQTDLLLNCHLIDKSAQDLVYALKNRPHEAGISISAMLDTLNRWS